MLDERALIARQVKDCREIGRRPEIDPPAVHGGVHKSSLSYEEGARASVAIAFDD